MITWSDIFRESPDMLDAAHATACSVAGDGVPLLSSESPEWFTPCWDKVLVVPFETDAGMALLAYSISSDGEVCAELIGRF